MLTKVVFILFLSLVFGLFSVYIYLRHFSIESIVESIDSLAESRTLVTTSVGHFVGTKVQFRDKTVDVFLGIPYALPPIGLLRFQRPVPVPESNHTFVANRWPNPCLQKDNHLSLNNYNFSEDCLYLNIWSPSAVGRRSRSRPVLVHIHTGALLFGSASETTYNGLVLSAFGDVIVVTFNYRLNIYGFLYTGADGVAPNAGMYDQVLALQWVTQHIRHFGGDANRVTLIGQSTGALAVGLHLQSPLSGHLFKSAVMISGSPLQHIWLSEPKAVEEFWMKYTEEVNCNEDKDLVLKCLTELNRNRLPSMGDCKRYSADPFVVSAPVVFDNQFRSRDSMKSLMNRNISILFGYTDDEGSWMLALEDRHRYGPNIKQNMSFAEAVNELKRFIAFIKPNTNHEISDKNIVKHYFNTNAMKRLNDKNLLSRTIGVALGDFYIACPLHSFVDYLFKSGNTSKVYQYLWSYKGNAKSSAFWRTFEDVWCGHWMGSCHSFELYSIFGIPFLQSLAFNDIDRRISMKMIETIRDFAYNHEPMAQKGIPWQRFHTIDGNIRKPYHVIDSGVSSGQLFGKDLKQYECDSLWRQWIIE